MVVVVVEEELTRRSYSIDLRSLGNESNTSWLSCVLLPPVEFPSDDSMRK